MKRRWIEAGGQYQFPFMGAASRTLRGERNIQCPKCQEGTLRCYYHVFDQGRMTGTLWVWCPYCGAKSHLPRVKPASNHLFQDPFKSLSLEEFGRLEQDQEEGFIEKLDRLWEEGSIGPPEEKQ